MQQLTLLASVICVMVTFSDVSHGFKIYRGKDSDSSRPWTAWLKKGKTRLHCGGSLIADSWVLTSARCIIDQVTDVVLGDDDLATDDGSEQVITIAESIPHPDYNKRTHMNDIALIRLADKAIISDNVSEITLVTNASDEAIVLDKHCRLAGWGFNSDLPAGPYCDQSLNELTVDHLTDLECEGQGYNRPLTAICIHPYMRQLSGLCPGDIGGPVICKARQLWMLVGVISAWNVTEECSVGIKGATTVAQYRPWIQSYLNST